MPPLASVLASLASAIPAASQQAPPPVAAPRPATQAARQPTPGLDAAPTLQDGFDALERLQIAWAFASPEVRARADLREHADAALAAWVRGERRGAVEAWTRLRLEVEGKQGDVDALLAAILRLEIIDGGVPTRHRRAFYSNGMWAGNVGVRVRALFDAPELAGHSMVDGEIWVQYDDVLFPELEPDDPRRDAVPIAFDDHGHMSPVRASVRLGPTGCWDSSVELRRAETVLDHVTVENATVDATQRRASFSRWIRELDDPHERAVDDIVAGEHATREDALWSARWRAFHSRLALMTDDASPERSAEFLIGRYPDPPRHDHAQLRWPLRTNRMLEAEALAFRSRVRGRGPLEVAVRFGPVWRTFAIGHERDLAAWVRMSAVKAQKAPPLVLVFHPEGFDEGWALALAGRGAFFALASPRRFGVLAVDNAPLAADPSALAPLLESVALEVDFGAVHLVGAGAGGALARRLAEAHPDLVAGVAVLPSGSGGAPVSALGLEGALDAALQELGL